MVDGSDSYSAAERQDSKRAAQDGRYVCGLSDWSGPSSEADSRAAAEY
jgi:hypothetical protein